MLPFLLWRLQGNIKVKATYSTIILCYRYSLWEAETCMMCAARTINQPEESTVKKKIWTIQKIVEIVENMQSFTWNFKIMKSIKQTMKRAQDANSTFSFFRQDFVSTTCNRSRYSEGQSKTFICLWKENCLKITVCIIMNKIHWGIKKWPLFLYCAIQQDAGKADGMTIT